MLDCKARIVMYVLITRHSSMFIHLSGHSTGRLCDTDSCGVAGRSRRVSHQGGSPIEITISAPWEQLHRQGVVSEDTASSDLWVYGGMNGALYL